jgi:hypothetical protein
MIRSETSKAHVIDCYQRADLTAPESQAHARLAHKHPSATPRTAASAGYNCHGLTFLSRRAWLITAAALNTVLEDDSYEEVSLAEPRCFREILLSTSPKPGTPITLGWSLKARVV